MRMSFEEWCRKVDEACWKLAGCSKDDLADYCYADAWQDGVSPVSAARKAIRADRCE